MWAYVRIQRDCERFYLKSVAIKAKTVNYQCDLNKKYRFEA